MNFQKIIEILGTNADNLLNHTCKTFDKAHLYPTSPNYIAEVLQISNKNIQVLRNLAALFNHGRLLGTGYLSILPIDQDIEHTAGKSFEKNPIYFTPKNIVKLFIEYLKDQEKRQSNSVKIIYGEIMTHISTGLASDLRGIEKSLKY